MHVKIPSILHTQLISIFGKDLLAVCIKVLGATTNKVVKMHGQSSCNFLLCLKVMMRRRFSLLDTLWITGLGLE